VCLSALFLVCYFIVFFISAAVPSDVTCKPSPSDCPKKVKHRNSSKLSSGTVVPLIFGLKSEGMIGSAGVQLQESSEVAAMSGAETAKMNSSTSTLVSLNKTYVKEAVTENRSEVDKVKSSDRNLMAAVTQKAGPTSGTKSLGLLSLFDPDVPLALHGYGYNKETTTSEEVTNRNGADVVPVMDNGTKSLGLLSLFDPDVPLALHGYGYNKETTTSEEVTNRNGADVVPVMDNSDSTSTATRVESPVDISLYIENIMEEMNFPNPLSPIDSGPETSRSHGQSMYYLICIYVFIIPVV